jgi:hypothetical protein
MTIRQDYIDRLIALANEFAPDFGVDTMTAEGFMPPTPPAPQQVPARTMDDVERAILVDQQLGRIRDDRIPSHGEWRNREPSVGERTAAFYQDAIGGDVGRRVAAPIGPLVDGAAGAADLAWRATGIPMAAEAGRNLAEAESPMRGAAAAAQLGLAAVPFTPAGRALTATVPRMVGTGAASAAAGTLASSPASAQGVSRSSDTAGPQPGLTPEETRQLAEARRRIAAREFASGAERRLLEADVVRLEARRDEAIRARRGLETDEARTKQERDARLQAEADAEVARIKRANMPFRDANPLATQMIAGGGMAGAAALGYRGQSVANRARNAEIDAARVSRDSALSTAQAAWNRGQDAKSIKSIDLADRQQDVLNAFGTRTPSPVGKPYLGATVMGEAGVSAPEILDYITSPASGQLRKDTTDKFADPIWLASRIGLGLGAGLIPAKIGATAANARSPVVGVPSRDAEINAFTAQPGFGATKAIWDARDALAMDKAGTIARAEHRAKMREINARGVPDSDGQARLPPARSPGTALPPPSSGPQGGAPQQTPPPGSPSGGRTDPGSAGPDTHSGAASGSRTSSQVSHHSQAQPRTKTGQFDGAPDPKRWKPDGE